MSPTFWLVGDDGDDGDDGTLPGALRHAARRRAPRRGQLPIGKRGVRRAVALGDPWRLGALGKVLHTNNNNRASRRGSPGSNGKLDDLVFVDACELGEARWMHCSIANTCEFGCCSFVGIVPGTSGTGTVALPARLRPPGAECEALVRFGDGMPGSGTAVRDREGREVTPGDALERTTWRGESR